MNLNKLKPYCKDKNIINIRYILDGIKVISSNNYLLARDDLLISDILCDLLLSKDIIRIKLALNLLK